VVEESQPVQIAAELARRGFEVRVYDPLALETARVELGEAVTYSADMKSCVKDADTVFIAAPDPAFKSLTASDFSNDRHVAVYDAWRTANRLEGAPNLAYVPLGRRSDGPLE
jgi:UDP-N-acetyl-D-mannosaminuronate dehydrogenase